MPEDLTRPLAKVLYEAHAHSRRLKTKWSDLGPGEKQHWYHISAAAISFWGDYADATDEDTVG